LLIAVPTAMAADDHTTVPGGAPERATVYSNSRVIVQWAAGAGGADKAAARDSANVDFRSNLGDPSFQLVVVEPGQTASQAVSDLESNPAVAVAERDGYRSLDEVPNDPLFGQLWGLRNLGLGIDGFSSAISGDDVNATAAWDRAVGSPSTVVADIDSGYRFDSPDLGPVAWENAADPPGGGDNDGNGYVDDTHGYDFVGANAESPTEDNDPTDDNLISGGHGIHTAGTIGAAGNNGTGITGVARNMRIMPIRVCANSAGAGNETRCPFSSILKGINYAGNMHARAANMSLGGNTFTQTEVNAIAAHPETLYVVSAGNDGGNNDGGEAAPKGHHYPCDYRPTEDASPAVLGAIDNIVCVAATDQADGLASFSDWGPTSVDLGAPGTEVLSTFPAKDNWDSDDFETNDFDVRWLPYESGFGRATTGDGALTSFGMTDTPGAAPEANHAYAVLSATNVHVPVGTGLCRIKGMRYRKGGSYNYGYYLDEGHSGIEEFIGGETAGGAMVAFQTAPILNLAGHTVTLYFKYTADSTPTAGEGIWLDDVHLECFAPLSTPLDYEFLQGTSMAAPHVTGAAGLLWSLKPSASVAEVRDALLNSVDPVSSLSGKTTTGGRLDIAAALDELVPPGTETVAPETAITAQPASSTQSTTAKFEFRRTDADAGSYECRIDGGAFEPCAGPDSFSVTVGAHTFQVRAKNAAGLVDSTPASATWTVTPSSSGGGEGGGGPTSSGGGSGSGGNISNQPSQPRCVVPKLTGKSLGQATAALAAAHCSLGTVTKPKAKKGHKLGPLVVKSSNPAPGSAASSGKVNITLGPKPKSKKHHH
jgi:subtilisin family serine protease